MNYLLKAKCYIKLDLQNIYHRIYIQEGNKWKIAFRTRYGYFKYQVLPFGLTNALVTFQVYINRTLVSLVDITCIVYLDDILIYSNDLTMHRQHVTEVLSQLQWHGLYAKLSKCKFSINEVKFLGFVLGPSGVAIEQSHMDTIQ